VLFEGKLRVLSNQVLIWQVPAWSTALFSLAITAAVVALANSRTIGEVMTEIDIRRTVSLFLAATALVILLLAVAFMKFRMHQAAVFRPNRLALPRRWFLPSGQACLLFILLLEASLMLDFSMVLSRIASPLTALALSVASLIGTFALYEYSFRRIRAEIERTLHPAQASA
jgi:hypothetical protein